MDVREDVRLDIEECVRDVEKCLPHNVLSLEHAVDFQIRIQRRADDAIRHGLEAELPRLRTLLERVDRAAHEIVLHEMVFELGFGEHPPTQEWKWTDFEHNLIRGRALGLDVHAAEEALTRAREVQAMVDEDLVALAPGRRERKKLDNAEAPATSASDATPASALVEAPPVTSASDATPASALGVRYLELVESLIPPTGDGAKTVALIVTALRQAVAGTTLGNLHGTRATIFDALHRAGVMPSVPSDRASRNAMNNSLADMRLVITRRSAADWIFHVGDLREPSPEIETTLRAEIRRLEDLRKHKN